MTTTTDPNDPGLRELHPGGQQKSYVVLSAEERARGFVVPVRYAYKHLACGAETTIQSREIAETYARDPSFYGGTFCVRCKRHFNLLDENGERAFLWDDGTPVGEPPPPRGELFGELFDTLNAVAVGMAPSKTRNDLEGALNAAHHERRELIEMIEQFCRDLNQAHDELLRAQGATPEQVANHDWPEWSPQANSIRWAEEKLGKPLSKARTGAGAARR